MALPIQDLPAWARLNDVSFDNVEVTTTVDKGYGVVSQKDLAAPEGTVETPQLLAVPHDLILNSLAVEEHAKEDKEFKQLLEAVGHHTADNNVATPRQRSALPACSTVLLPTVWTEDERPLLKGTSLEVAVGAKLRALDNEFEMIREASSDIPYWNGLLWHSGAVSLKDWVHLDALYRSRCLELPKSGESMVPCIDMINHSSDPSAYYDQNSDYEAVLLLRPGASMSKGQEVTISYGDTKSAAEMLFSYGFIDPESTSESLVLPLAPFPDDPLAKAKLVAFGKAPKVHVARESGSIRWDSNFAYLKCVNEEDGLDFRILQDNEGNQQLRVFWQDEDVTDQISEFQKLVAQTHPLPEVLRLRVAVSVQENLEIHLEQLKSELPRHDSSTVREECLKHGLLLRQIETSLLEDAIQALEQEKNSLLEAENVVAYLGSMETSNSDLVGEEASNEADDFS
ncbi:uncharacterized protein PODANS_2_2130 [Podospora anserina S mat+]|uniref:Podospora anserina S mat+ genomic DNA chromosome 2, supercontig 2 n=1 Tax=Podospora anserina (strain S / ATCC MYA-4624 / DSM 980 / FGSC 10383) TaxID=515849 RepID=B2B4Q9_PODAN|nr:uncharacterized protein PODANS_2_2130 [Podospora anserina S mat+]CAP72784.1 unnamed protein product [Podospora anserina S mat+]CDP25182.1 Putative protein similar to of SET8 of Schizosaccharomyces pombe [Podospora anserina S mat+]